MLPLISDPVGWLRLQWQDAVKDHDRDPRRSTLTVINYLEKKKKKHSDTIQDV